MNGIQNAEARYAAVGSESATIHVPRPKYNVDANFGGLSLLEAAYAGSHLLRDRVPLVRLDEEEILQRRCPSVIKVDVEGMEMHVLDGARGVLQRCKPVLFLENNCMRTSPMLLASLDEAGYDAFWSVEPVFSPGNFRKRRDNIFGAHLSINVLAIPRDREVLTRPDTTLERVVYGAIDDSKKVRRGFPYLHEYNFTVLVQVDDPDAHRGRVLVQDGNATWCP
mmetsp:Transcript_8661/g.25213  ORF Transcript_8661/g.25213 Transcript_8661/m.25213 type:complete len:223 (-) Transcript_8661:811-1479(-)